MWLPSDQPQHQMPPVTHTHTCAGLHSEKTSCCLPTCLAILSQILGLKHYIAHADTGRSVHPPPYHSFVASSRYGGPDAPALQITLSTLMAYNPWSQELHTHTELFSVRPETKKISP